MIGPENVMCVYDSAGDVIETHEHEGDSKGVVRHSLARAAAFVYQ